MPVSSSPVHLLLLILLFYYLAQEIRPCLVPLSLSCHHPFRFQGPLSTRYLLPSSHHSPTNTGEHLKLCFLTSFSYHQPQFMPRCRAFCLSHCFDFLAFFLVSCLATIFFFPLFCCRYNNGKENENWVFILMQYFMFAYRSNEMCIIQDYLNSY